MLRGPFVLLYTEVRMRTGRRKAALLLTPDERQRLESLAHRSRSAAALARRARIILACAEGTDSKVVARRLHVAEGGGNEDADDAVFESVLRFRVGVHG